MKITKKQFVELICSDYADLLSVMNCEPYLRWTDGHLYVFNPESYSWENGCFFDAIASEINENKVSLDLSSENYWSIEFEITDGCFELNKNYKVEELLYSLGKITSDFTEFEKSLNSATARVTCCGNKSMLDKAIDKHNKE